MEVFKLNLPGKEQKEAYVMQMFNLLAVKYDLLNTLMTFGMDKRWRRVAVRQADLKPGDQVLDICCGTGRLSMELARTVGKEGKVMGLDFSENMLKEAEKALAGFSYRDTVDLMQGNAMELPFPDNSFDAVTVGWGLRNVPDIAVVLSEMIRVTKPGGMVVSLDMAKTKIPVFKQLYWFYFEQIVPLLGRIFASRESAYTYLHDSTLAFPGQEELTKIFSSSGLTEASYQNLCGGVVAVVSGRKR